MVKALSEKIAITVAPALSCAESANSPADEPLLTYLSANTGTTLGDAPCAVKNNVSTFAPYAVALPDCPPVNDDVTVPPGNTASLKTAPS